MCRVPPAPYDQRRAMSKSLSFGHQEPAPPTSVADADADERTLPGRLSQRTSQATLTPQSLPDGCSYGSIPAKDGEGAEKRVIWVDFPPASPDNPICFSKSRKFLITAVVLLYTFWCCECAPGAPGAPEISRASGCHW